MRSLPRLLSLIALVVLVAFAPARTQTQAVRSPFDSLHFRGIGPAATGGIWKSTNKGVTWKDIFANQPDNTFGALAIFERDPKIIWAGTGEQNNRQSSSRVANRQVRQSEGSPYTSFSRRALLRT